MIGKWTSEVYADNISNLIALRRAFRIGARGIACECTPYAYGWNIDIDRAFVHMQVDDISVLDDADNFHLCYSTDDGKSYESLLDLSQYTKLTW